MFTKLNPINFIVAFACIFLVPVSAVMAQNEFVEYELRMEYPNGNPIAANSNIGLNTDFVLVVAVRDIRSTPLGVFSAYLDIFYDETKVEPTGQVVQHLNFPSVPFGDLSEPGLINEAGGVGGIEPGTNIDGELFRINMKTTTVGGPIRFKADPADDSIAHPTLLYGLNVNVSRCQTNYFSSGLRTPACDVDDDGECDIDDVNALTSFADLSGSINVTVGVDEQYDINCDGVINQSDLLAWLEDAALEHRLDLPFYQGDVNLDGTVNAQDFVVWNTHKFTPQLEFTNGDINGDGFVNGQDFVIWNTHKFKSSTISCGN